MNGSSPTPREWDTAYNSIGYRGNPTSNWTLSGTTTAVFDRYGNTASGTSANGVSSTISTVSSTNYAAPTQITVGSLTTNLSYAGNSFLGLTNETGPNGTSVSLGYDANARPTSSTSPFGATTTTAYNDTASLAYFTCTMVDGRWTQTNLDGLGRPILTLTGYGSTCGQGTILTQAESTYGSCGCSPLGKLISQAVPHAYGTSATATTTYTYDGIGRTLSKAVVGSDTQGTTTYAYQGNTVTVTDPAGKWKAFTTDGYGNLVQVAEPNPAGGSNYTTSYTYDLMNRLIGVSMPRSTGTQTRSWTYTGAFLTSATNPENGTVSYTYGSNNMIATRTDAKGQVVAYTYDSQARLTEVQRYPSGLSNGADVCQEEDYLYGLNPLGSSYPQNASGLLSAVKYMGGYNPNVSPTCDTTFTEMYNYGVPGAPVGKQLTVSRGGGSFALAATYTYDTEGRTTTETYPTDHCPTDHSGNTASLSYTFDAMGRLNAMTDNIASQPIILGTTYGPANELLSITGVPCCSPGWRGESYTYNSLKQLTSVTAGDASMSISYAYPSTSNNGKIASQTDAISGETVTYAYDTLNRLATAQNQSGFSPSWGQSFAYDGFGNLTNTNVIKGSAPSMAATYDANNHAGGEDANGNPGYVPAPAQGTSVPGAYDVENRVVSLNIHSLMNYSYAPDNKRVWRGNNGNGTDEVTFWSISGRKMGTYNITQSGSTLYCTQSGVNLYFGGKLIKNASGWVYPDRLGSVGKYYPYGIERPSATGNNTEKFTGYYRDAETGNDYAVNRYESPGTGRFLTPDRMSGTAADPSSWNKYAYVEGDPINDVDEEGLCRTPVGGGGGGGFPIGIGIGIGIGTGDPDLESRGPFCRNPRHPGVPPGGLVTGGPLRGLTYTNLLQALTTLAAAMLPLNESAAGSGASVPTYLQVASECWAPGTQISATYTLEVTYQVENQFQQPMNGAQLAGYYISESFSDIIGNIGNLQPYAIWSTGPNAVTPQSGTINGLGQFTDNLSAGGLPGLAIQEGGAFQSFTAYGPGGINQPLTVLGFGSPATLLNNHYAPNSVTINGMGLGQNPATKCP